MLDILKDVDLNSYHKDLVTEDPRGALSVSVAKKLLKSCKHGWAHHPRYGGGERMFEDREEVTLSMKLGTILDEILTNQERRIVPVEFANFLTKESQRIKKDAEAIGKVAATKPMLERARDRAASVIKTLEFHGLRLDGAEKQVMILWDEQASNGEFVQCKALLDYVWFKTGLIRDLKSSSNAEPGPRLGNHLLSMGYHIQGVAYTRALEAAIPELAGRVKFENIVVEDKWPYECSLSEYDGKAITLGQVLWQRAVDRWEECTRTGKWPGYMQNGKPWSVTVPAYLEGDLYNDSDDSDEPEQKW